MKLAITGLGMVTSLGFDVIGSCAAQRAGLSSPRPLAHFDASEEGGAPAALTGHPVPWVSEGFEHIGCWLQLATASLEDLQEYARLPPPRDEAFWQRTGLVVAVPLMDPDRFLVPRDAVSQVLRQHYLQPLVQLAKLPIHPSHVEAVELGHCGALEAARLAEAWIQQRRVDRVIVVGADSYVDPRSLSWLVEAAALKTPENPVGLSPGEAGACFLLERPESARARDARFEATLEAVAVDTSYAEDWLDAPRIARHLAQVVRTVVAAGTARPIWGDLLLDLNGEEWRARVWGHAQVQLRSELDLPRCRTVLPCTSFGETGTASGALAVGLAVRAFTRGYAGGPYGLVCSVNEDGHVAVGALSQPG
jgi:3-oxoacyl-[acyl-carrier-protein] synthase-1